MRNLSIKALAWAQNRRSQEEGQTVIEYALVVAAVSIVLIVLMAGFGPILLTSAAAKVAAFGV